MIRTGLTIWLSAAAVSIVTGCSSSPSEGGEPAPTGSVRHATQTGMPHTDRLFTPGSAVLFIATAATLREGDFRHFVPPRPLLMAPHIGTPEAVYALPAPLVLRLAELDDAEISPVARRWAETVLFRDSRHAEWTLHRYRVAARHAIDTRQELYVYQDDELRP